MPTQLKTYDLSAALKRMGGDVHLLKQVVGFVKVDCPEIMDRLRASAARGDAAGVQIAAHSLKGMVVNFDAQAASQAAIRVEQMGEAGDLSQTPEAIQSLEDELARLWSELESELAGL